LTLLFSSRIIKAMQEPVVKRQNRLQWAFFLVLALAVGFGAGNAYSKTSVAHADQGKLLAVADMASTTVTGVGDVPPRDLMSSQDFSKFWDLWRMLKEKYYKQPVDEKVMLYGAMSGLASSLDDPYTVFFEPVTAKAFNQELSGKFDGIGAEIGMKDGQIVVIAPLPGMPAEKAGLLAGDMILKIDKQDTAGMYVDKAVSLIRGKRGTPVSLYIGRFKLTKGKNGKTVSTPTTLEIAIIRDQIEVKSVNVTYLPGKIARISVSSFNQDTDVLFSSAVQDVLSKDTKGVILDLRNDPGGYLDKAISMASEWVGDLVVVKEQRQGKIVEEYRGNPTARLRDMPTVVLINAGSASASEIVSGALQDYKKAKLVGTKSFGKGSVQDYTDLSDGSAVKITIAEWLTPTNRSINKVGIDPDVSIDITQDDINAQRDPQLDKAVELLTGKPTPQSATSTAPTSGTTKK